MASEVCAAIGQTMLLKPVVLWCFSARLKVWPEIVEGSFPDTRRLIQVRGFPPIRKERGWMGHPATTPRSYSVLARLDSLHLDQVRTHFPRMPRHKIGRARWRTAWEVVMQLFFDRDREMIHIEIL